MGSEFNLVSLDAQRALEEFAQDFAAALIQSGVEPWAKDYGLYKASRALKTTWPIPVSAAGYTEFKGDLKYRDLFEKSLTMQPKTWQDGIAALASVIEAPDFIGWTSEPAAMAAAAMSLPNDIIAGQIEANPTCWTGKAFFAADHPFNVFDAGVGTFDNDFTGSGTDVTINNLVLAMQGFDALKAANGRPLGLQMTHVFHPPTQRQAWKQLLEQDLVIQAIGTAFGSVNNIYKGSIKPVCCYELTDADKWYPAALNKPGMKPWIVQDEGSPEEIRQDKTDALYKTTLKVGIAYILRGNGALALPHCMQRWAGTSS